jgi:hypothetical protein
LQAILKLYHVQGITVVQTGTTTQAITSLSQGLVDGIITSAPFTFRLMKDGYREFVGPKDFKKAGVEFLIQGLVARKSFAVKNREVVTGMIKATMEGVRQIFVNEKHAKSVLAKYTRQTDPDILDQTYRFALDIFIKDPTVTANSIRPIVNSRWNSIWSTPKQQHAADGVLRQQLCRRVEALRLVGGPMEVKESSGHCCCARLAANQFDRASAVCYSDQARILIS